MYFLNVNITFEKTHLAVLLERRPVAAYYAVVSNNGLEDSAVVMGMMAMFLRKHYIATLIADEVFVVGRN